MCFGMASMDIFTRKFSIEELSIIFAIITLVLTTIIILFSRHRKRGKFVTLIGLCDAGKTLLLSRVRRQ